LTYFQEIQLPGALRTAFLLQPDAFQPIEGGINSAIAGINGLATGAEEKEKGSRFR